ITGILSAASTSATIAGEGESEVISQPAPTSCIQLPTLATIVAIHRLRKSPLCSGRQAEDASRAGAGRVDSADPEDFMGTRCVAGESVAPPSPGSSGERHRSSFVLLDDPRRANVSCTHVIAELAQRTALSQQIPTLVEFDLDGGQSPAFGGIERSFVEQAVLFSDEVLNVGQHGCVFRLVFHKVSVRLFQLATARY